MVFNGYHDHKRDSGQLHGKQIDVACKSWTTSTGKITPLMIKHMEDGEFKPRLRGFCILYHSDFRIVFLFNMLFIAFKYI